MIGEVLKFTAEAPYRYVAGLNVLSELLPLPLPLPTKEVRGLISFVLPLEPTFLPAVDSTRNRGGSGSSAGLVIAFASDSRPNPGHD